MKIRVRGGQESGWKQNRSVRPPQLLELHHQFGSKLPTKQGKEGNFVYSLNTYLLSVHYVTGTKGYSRE